MEDEFYKFLPFKDDCDCLSAFNTFSEKDKIEIVLCYAIDSKQSSDMELIKKIMLKLYDEVQVQFFIKVLKIKSLAQEEKIIEEYSSKKYDCHMFCRKGPEEFWWTEAKILKNKDYTDIKNSINDLFAGCDFKIGFYI